MAQVISSWFTLLTASATMLMLGQIFQNELADCLVPKKQIGVCMSKKHVNGYTLPMNSKPIAPIAINTPLPKNEVLITCVFKYGYLDETDGNFGLGHLTEHCMVANIHQELETKDIWGHIDDNFTTLNILLDKHIYETKYRDEDIIAKLSRQLNNISDNLIRNEQDAITLELHEKYNSSFSIIAESIRKSIINQPNRLGRMRIRQMNNIAKFTTKNIQDCISRILSSTSRIFVGSSLVKNSDEFIKGDRVGKRLIKPINVTFKKAKKHLVVSNEQKKSSIIYFAAAFPSLDTTSTLQARFSLGFLIQEISAVFEKNARLHGSYETFYEYCVEQSYGYCWFGLTSLKNIDDPIKDEIIGIVKQIISNPDISQKIARYKRIKKMALRKDWSHGLSRHDWVVEDYIELGKIFDLKYTFSSLDLLNTTTVKATARNIFKKSNALTVKILGSSELHK